MVDHIQSGAGPAPAASLRAQCAKEAGRLRLLHVVSHLHRGGMEYGVLKLFKGLDPALFEQKICAVRDVDPEFASAQQVDAQLFRAGESAPGFQFAVFRLARIMKLYQPHIVHSRNWGALEAIPAARLAGIPVSIHSEHGYELDNIAGLPYRRRMLRRVLYPLADALFTVSEDLRSYHARQAWIAQERIQVIYNGVDTLRYSPVPAVGARLRKEHNIPPESFVVGAVGRMVPIKDHKSLLEAATVLRQQGVDVYVFLVGAGPEFAKLREQAALSSELAGRVIFSGATDDVCSFLNAMDVFVLPSICEGFSNTILEAMASGLPVLATRVGGNPELVAEDRTGRLFRPGDVRGLAGLLQQFAADRELGRRIGRAARHRAVEQFGIEKMFQRYESLYLELAARRRVAGKV